MQMKNDTYTTYENGWIFRIHPAPTTSTAPVLLLLHGWGGDENVMWVFTGHLNNHYCLLAPRGLLHTQPMGYGWAYTASNNLTNLSSLFPMVDLLLAQVDYHRKSLAPNTQTEPLSLMGFSQGAALAYAIALRYPERVKKLAALSGFLPDGAETYRNNNGLAGKPVLITHGSLDQIVPVETARRDAVLLERLGASVTYCEESVGHKLGKACFRKLDEFFLDNSI